MQIKSFFSFITITLIMGAFIIVLSNPFFEGFIVLIWVVYFIASMMKVVDTLADQKVYAQQHAAYLLDRQKKRYEFDNLRLRRLVETLGSGVLLIAADETIQIINATFYETFKRSNLKGQSFHALSDIEPLYKKILEAVIAEQSSRFQIAYDAHFYDLIMTPLVSDEGYQGMLVLITDITSLKNAEHYQKQFTADVSHELKTPLSALIGMSEILKDKTVDDATQEDFIQTIYDESMRLEVMISDLLTISKMDRLDYTLTKEPTPLKTIIKNVEKLLRTIIDKKGLSLTYDIEDVTLMVDKHRMQQVLINLIKNAVAYTDEGGIKVTGKVDGEYYRLAVQDSGIGMAPEHLPYVFKRFYRIDEGRGRDSGGSGLGLSITKNVILKHGGQIFAESREGEGTTFTMLLPM